MHELIFINVNRFFFNKFLRSFFHTKLLVWSFSSSFVTFSLMEFLLFICACMQIAFLNTIAKIASCLSQRSRNTMCVNSSGKAHQTSNRKKKWMEKRIHKKERGGKESRLRGAALHFSNLDQYFLYCLFPLSTLILPSKHWLQHKKGLVERSLLCNRCTFSTLFSIIIVKTFLSFCAVLFCYGNDTSTQFSKGTTKVNCSFLVFWELSKWKAFFLVVTFV